MEMLSLSVICICLSFWYAVGGTIINLIFRTKINQFKPLIYSIMFFILSIVKYYNPS